jgi:hypothetical protein
VCYKNKMSLTEGDANILVNFNCFAFCSNIPNVIQTYWSFSAASHFVLTYRTWYKHIGHFQLLHISFWLTERDTNILVIFSCFTFRSDLPNVIQTYWAFSAASHFVLTYRMTSLVDIICCFAFRSDLPNVMQTCVWL